MSFDFGVYSWKVKIREWYLRHFRPKKYKKIMDGEEKDG